MNKFLKKIIWLIMIAPAIYLLIIWKSLPAIVPIHYNLKGEADRFGDKAELWILVGVLTVVNLAVYLLLTNLYKIDPRKKALENKDKMYRMATAVTIFIAVVGLVIIYYTANPNSTFKAQYLLIGMGLLFAFLGNYMYTIKPNHFAGFRMRSTLNNEDNWRRTHLLGGKLWFAGGLLIAIISFFIPATPAFIISAVIILAMVLIPGIYSYRLYKKQTSVHPIN